MAFSQGIYFRATNNQTSPAGYDAEVGTSNNYPRTPAFGDAVAVGWEAGLTLTGRDRTGPTDVRLKGIEFASNNAGAFDYRIDLPAPGDYTIRLAMGDAAAAQSCRVRFIDTSTQFADIDASVSAGHWVDATGVDRASESAWVSNNAPLARTFGSTIFRARFGSSVSPGSSNWAVAALAIDAAAGGGTTYTDTLSESLTAGDALAAIATWANALSESLTASDSMAGGLLLASQLSESLTPADSLSAVMAWGAALSESLSASDALASNGTFGVSLEEILAAADLYRIPNAAARAIIFSTLIATPPLPEVWVKMPDEED